MNESNGTWACFDCRTSVRRPASATSVTCTRCSRACENLGKRIPIPRRQNEVAWRRLREHFMAATAARADRKALYDVRRQHYLEKRIADLESRPTSPSLVRQIRKLQEELASRRGVVG